MNKYLLLLIFSALAVFSACTTTQKQETRPPEELFKASQELIEEDDLIEAANLLEVIQTQYPASSYADDAQFYLAEIDFLEEEFIYAAFNYNKLRQNYPASEYVKRALFKAAACYYELSPTYDRDQEYTRRAIDAYQEYQMVYSERDSLYDIASRRIDDMREKLAHRQYSIANLYRKMDNPESALIYYDFVIEKYDDTKYYEDAYFGKIEVLVELKRYDEALGILELYKRSFPNGQYSSTVAEIKQNIRTLRDNPAE